MNAYTANKMTRASTVTPGQASAMMPTATARMPRRIREVLRDLNMTGFLFFRSPPRTPKVSRPELIDAPGQQPVDCKATITCD
jgi:hypothetical protein